MKKICAAILAMLLVLGVFTACSGAKDEVNPEILGVKDAAAVEQGKEYDALAGVTATDDKDGDLTAKDCDHVHARPRIRQRKDDADETGDV